MTLLLSRRQSLLRVWQHAWPCVLLAVPVLTPLLRPPKRLLGRNASCGGYHISPDHHGIHHHNSSRSSSSNSLHKTPVVAALMMTSGSCWVPRRRATKMCHNLLAAATTTAVTAVVVQSAPCRAHSRSVGSKSKSWPPAAALRLAAWRPAGGASLGLVGAALAAGVNMQQLRRKVRRRPQPSSAQR